MCFFVKTKWLVRVKKEVKFHQLLCNACKSTLTKTEKQFIYRLHSGKYCSEKRVCINCSKTWNVLKENSKTLTRITHFCTECNKSLSTKDKDKILRENLEGYHEKEKLQRRESHKRNIIHNMLSRAKQRALKYGYCFDISDSDIVIPKVCPLLNIPFVLGEGSEYEYTPTIDRIDNTKGYTRDNIWIISKKANSMKNSATFEELKTFSTKHIKI